MSEELDIENLQELLDIFRNQKIGAINLKMKEVKFEIDLNGKKAELILKLKDL